MGSKTKADKKANPNYDQNRQELTTQQIMDIKEAFDIFDTSGVGTIESKDLKVALRAVGFEPSKEELKYLILSNSKLTKDIDDKDEKEEDVNLRVDFNEFMDIMIMKMSEKDTLEDIKKSFKLFDEDSSGAISFDNLESVAKDLNEEMTEEEILELIRGATKQDILKNPFVKEEDFINILTKY